jgi:hypothetical protein
MPDSNGNPTPEEIQAVQGTRLDERAPWETYGGEMLEVLPEELELAVQEYASRDPHGKTDSQTQEEFCRQKELADAAAEDYKWVRQEDYEEEDARIGQVMHSTTLLKKLSEQCGLNCWYAAHGQKGRLTLRVDTSHGTLPGEVGCWVQSGFMPEYSIANFDDHGVILQEAYRGWRTVILQLIVKSMLNADAAVRVFGEAYGPASERYNSILYGLRNRK